MTSSPPRDLRPALFVTPDYCAVCGMPVYAAMDAGWAARVLDWLPLPHGAYVRPTTERERAADPDAPSVVADAGPGRYGARYELDRVAATYVKVPRAERVAGSARYRQDHARTCATWKDVRRGDIA